MNIDTRYVSGNLEQDIQFLRDNLTRDDVHMIQAQLQFIMSYGSGKIEATEENPKWTK
jgi:hypothetical protein